MKMNDNAYMQLALQLAQKGCGYVSPNPMVGAVIVKNERIIGSGYQEKYGNEMDDELCTLLHEVITHQP